MCNETVPTPEMMLVLQDAINGGFDSEQSLWLAMSRATFAAPSCECMAEPVARLVVRMERADMGQSLAPNPPYKYAEARAFEAAEAMPLGEYMLYLQEQKSPSASCAASNGVTADAEQLREVEVAYLADVISHSIANLGYPVGLGIPPSEEHARKAAETLFGRFVAISKRLAAPPADVQKDAERYQQARFASRWMLNPDRAMTVAEVDAYYDAAIAAEETKKGNSDV